MAASTITTGIGSSCCGPLGLNGLAAIASVVPPGWDFRVHGGSGNDPSGASVAASWKAMPVNGSPTATTFPSKLASTVSNGSALRVAATSAGLLVSTVSRLARVSDESSSCTPATAISSDSSTFSVTRAWVPTRRASASIAAWSARSAASWRRRPIRRPPRPFGRPAAARARPVGGAIGPVGLTQGEQPGDDRHDQGGADANEERSQLAVDTNLVASAILGGEPFAVGSRLGGGEELPLDQVEIGRRPVPPLDGLGQALAPVQLGVRAPHGVPRLAGRGEVAEDPLALHVVIEPVAQPGPGPDE